MEAVSKGAYLVGGHVIGVTAPSLFPWRSGANPYVTELIEADNLTHRIGILMELAVATIALPGSIGTATELMVAWNMNQTAKRGGGPPLPTVAVGEQWSVVIEMLAREINADATDIKLVATTNEAIDWVMVALEIH
jgi:predicted Rossmann-fold nucleotide-binding protein